MAAAGGAAITAFYMFRLWFLTFAGQPRDAHRYEHAHESPRVMYVPLIILAVFAVGVAWKAPFGSLVPAGAVGAVSPGGNGRDGVRCLGAVAVAERTLGASGGELPIDRRAGDAGWRSAPRSAASLLALAMYVFGRLNPSDVSRQFAPLYRFLRNKWWFDELYEVAFVRPVHAIVGLVCRRWTGVGSTG